MTYDCTTHQFDVKRLTISVLILGCLILCVPAGAQERITDGLVAWYPLGPDVQDHSGNAWHGQRHGGFLAVDRLLRPLAAVGLDGLASWIMLPSAEGILGADPDAWTVALWFRASSLHDHQTLVSDYRSTGHDTRFGFHLWQDTDGYLHGQVRKQHLQEWTCTTLGPVAPGDWHHVVFSVSRVTGLCRLFLDGELQEETAIDAAVDYIDPVEVTLGMHVFGNEAGGLYHGTLDDVRFYGRALADDEIADLHRATFESGLAARYPLDGHAEDVGGRALHGTVDGATPQSDQFGGAELAMHFDGTAAITLPSAEEIFGPDPVDWTVEGWFRIDTYADTVTLVSDYASGNHDTRYGCHVWMGVDGRLHGQLRKQHLDEATCTSRDPVETGEWHHFAFTATREHGRCRLYLDGELQEEQPFATDVDYIDDVPIQLGKHVFDGGDWGQLSGDLDNVSFYGRELLADEIADRFALTYQSGLAAIYPLDGDALDAGDAGLDGVVSGATPGFDGYGFAGCALSFDGVDDYVSLPGAGSILGADPEASAVSFRFRVDRQGEIAVILSDYNSGDHDTRFAHHVWLDVDGRLHASLRKQHLEEWDCQSIDPIQPGEWRHGLMTVSKSLGLVRLYLDGVIQQELVIATDADYVEDVPFHLGRSVFQGADHGLFPGDIDDVRFWSRWVPAAEAQALARGNNAHAGSNVAVLITNSQAPSSEDLGFLAVCNELFVHDVVGVDEIASEEVTLGNFDVVVCSITGSPGELAGFADPVVQQDVQQAGDAGVRFVLAGGGALLIEILGLGTTSTDTYSPDLADSWFVVGHNQQHPILTDVATLPDPDQYTIPELDALEHESLLWRVDPASTTTYVTLDYTSIDPDAYFAQCIWTGYQVSPPTDRIAFWFNGNGNVLYLHPFFWTEDNDTGVAGRIGPAGKKLLVNAVEVFRANVTGVPDDRRPDQVPDVFVTGLGNYPNPFNPATTIVFDLLRPAEASVAIYGIDGRRVRTLRAGRFTSGRQEIVWDGRDDAGATTASGIYLVRVLTERHAAARKITLLK